MALPKQVEEAARRSEEIANEYLEKEVEDILLPDEEDVDTTTQEAEGATTDEDGGELSTKEAEDGTNDKEPEIDWQHKYAVLQGKYNSEVPRLQKQLRTLESRFDFVVKNTPEVKQAEQLNSKEFEDYGEEIVRLVNIVNELRTENENLKGNVSNISNSQEEFRANQSENEVKAFYAQLSQLCPTWQKLNVDPKFISWLRSSADEFGSVSRQDVLNQATYKGDAFKVAEVFNKFKTETYSQKQNKPNKSTIEEQAAPPAEAPSAPFIANTNKGRTWKTSDIKKFYRDRKLGRYASRPDIADKLEQDLFRATAEGRVVKG